MVVEIIPVRIEREIKPGDDLVSLTLASPSAPSLQDGDIVVFTQKVISKQEGRIVRLSDVHPGLLATGIASEYGKDPRIVQLILDQTKRIVRMRAGIIISETVGGFICANAGVDESNILQGYAGMLPQDSDATADKFRRQIMEKTGKKVAVLISDTFGRPFRMGQTNVAIGIAGISAMIDYSGKFDVFGRILRVTAISVADELCSAAELVMGKSLQVPVSVIRNYEFSEEKSSVRDVMRKPYEDFLR